MHNHTFLIIIALLFIGCNEESKPEEPKDYKIIYEGGIYVEKFDSTNVADSRYTDNNRTYRAYNELIYDYYYQDRKGVKYKFEETEDAIKLDYQDRVSAWRLVHVDSITDRTIEKVELEVTKGLQPMSNNNPDYNQTVIGYKYPQVNGERNFNSYTGVIENEKNVWTHPPRDRLFRILELNPFPFIQAPYEIGTKWKWNLTIGSHWADERWKTWDGSIENNYNYEIVDKTTITTKIGDLECYVVHSTATSSLGQTHLTSYFNVNTGFVRLHYVNIDSSKMILEIDHFSSR